MDDFVIWQEFMYEAYGPLIIVVVAAIIAAGLGLAVMEGMTEIVKGIIRRFY